MMVDTGARVARWTPRSGFYDGAKWVKRFVIITVAAKRLERRPRGKGGNTLPSDTRAVGKG